MSKKLGVILVVGVIIVIAATFFVHQRESEGEYIVKIGYLPLTANLPLFVAIEKGFFDEAGVKVELEKFESSNQMVNALVTSRIDVETSASSSVIVTVGQKLAGNIRIFMLNAFTPSDFLSSILVKKDSAILEAKDLRGKKIGAFPGSTMRMYTEMVLEALNVQPEEIIQLTPPTQLGALDTGAVDALMTLEPLGTLGEVKGIASKLIQAPVETYVLDPWVAGSYSLSTEFLESHPKVAVRLIGVLYKAVDFIRSSPAEAKKAMTKYTPVTDEGLASRLTVPNYWKVNEIQVADFQRMADNLLSHGQIDNKVNVNDLIMKKVNP